MMIVLSLFVISGLFTVFQLVKIGGELKEIADYDIILTEKFTQATIHQLHQAIIFEKALREGELIDEDEDEDEDEEIKIDYEKQKVYFNKLSNTFESEMDEMVIFVEDAKLHANSKDSAKKFANIQVAIKKINKEHHQYAAMANEIFAFIDKREMDKAHKLTYDAEALQDQIDRELEEALLDIEHFTEKSIKKALKKPLAMNL
ncbi:MAG: hypothetical protein AAFZ92_07830 [Pseudomonadota bacterium]